MKQSVLGVDFGLSVTDAVLVRDAAIQAHARLHRPGPASTQVLERILAEPGMGTAADLDALAVTGGRSRELPDEFNGVPVSHVSESEAIGRGGLALSGLDKALVVSCGTGTAMIEADSSSGENVHRSGTAVGGGTLEGLGMKLLGLRNASEVAGLALQGDSGAVDTTLRDVLGEGIGRLPPAATAVNLGRLADLDNPGSADLAAGLVNMVGQTIALIALNVARVNRLDNVVFIGRMARFEALRQVFRSVFTLYGVQEPHFPDDAAQATAYGAALTIRNG